MKKLKLLTLLMGLMLSGSAWCQVNSSIENDFKKHSSEIEGPDRDCSVIHTLVGDLNGDGVGDAIAYYSCSPKGGGNANVGTGIAIFISKNGKLHFIGVDENYVGFIPGFISGGIIYGDVFSYAEHDPRCCPSIKTPMKLRLVNHKLQKIN